LTLRETASGDYKYRYTGSERDQCEVRERSVWGEGEVSVGSWRGQGEVN